MRELYTCNSTLKNLYQSTLAASMALATVINCCSETDWRSHLLLKTCRAPDRLFDISTPFSNANIFHPSSPISRLESEADRSSCMQLSLAYDTYLRRESSLIVLLMDKHKLYSRTLIEILLGKYMVN
jgi:hypothetical protein